MHICLLGLILLFSQSLQTLRLLKVKKSIALEKLKEKCGEHDWRESKYAYAIDLFKTSLWQIDNTLDKALKVQYALCKSGAYLNKRGNVFATSDTIDLSTQENVKILKPPSELSPDVIKVDKSIVKQRSREWEEERKNMKVTGSSIYKAIGCDGLKRQREHFDQVISNIDPPEPSQEQRKAMQHGVDSEIHQIATLSGIIMPFMFPNLTFYEEGFYVLDGMVVSPDGSLRNTETKDSVYAFEGKAPTSKYFKTSVQYSVPERYITQTLFEQRSTRAQSGTLYMSWSEKSCTLFKVLPDEDMCLRTIEEIDRVYNCDIPKRRTHVSAASKEMKKGLVDIAENSIFLGEFSTVKGYFTTPKEDRKVNSPYYQCNTTQRTSEEDVAYDELRRHLLLGKEVLGDTYEMQRTIASQVVVFLLADLNRFWKEEQPHAVPIAYFYRGYSLSMDITRRIAQECKEKCRNNGLDIIVTAADGEFSQMIVRGYKDNPLTQHQLSKDVWCDVCKMSKSEIISCLQAAATGYTVSKTKFGEKRIVRVVCSKHELLSKIKTPIRGWKSEDPKPNEPIRVIAQNIENDDSGLRRAVDIIEDELHELTLHRPNEPVEEKKNCDTLFDVEDIGHRLNLAVEHHDTNSTEANIPIEWASDIVRTLKALDERKWSDINHTTVTKYFSSAENMKQFTVKELNELTKCVNNHIPAVKSKFKVSGLRKHELINQLSRAIGDGSQVTGTQTYRRKKTVDTLKTLASRIIIKKNYPKKVLNIAYSNFIWVDRMNKWRRDAHVNDMVTIVGLDYTLAPYYVPDYNPVSRDFEISVYDKTHLGSNLRKAICLNKVEGISTTAWYRVSERNPNVLNKAILEVSEEGKVLDQMKEKLARALFTDEVQNVMKENGDFRESHFCKIIHNGLYTAEDTSGIPAVDRCRMRVELIDWLDENVNFGDFPPYGAKIKGLSYVLYEGLRCSTEAKLFLYALAKSGSYCARAPNTLCSESFFSTMQEMDPWGQGVLTTDGVEKHISDFTAITALKMTQDRSFYIKTKRDAAYPLIDIPSGSPMQDTPSNGNTRVCRCRENAFITCINPRDHFFDTQARARRSTKPDNVFRLAGINEPTRGDLPVRAQYGYTIHEHPSALELMLTATRKHISDSLVIY